MTQPNFKDMTGKRIGKLTVIKRSHNDNWGRAVWLCKCDCGNEIPVAGNPLRNGKIVDCGCISKANRPRKKTAYELIIEELTLKTKLLEVARK